MALRDWTCFRGFAIGRRSGFALRAVALLEGVRRLGEAISCESLPRAYVHLQCCE